MPGRNGTGPLGRGPMTGRGMGNCGGRTADAVYGYAGGPGFGGGFGRGRGRGRGFGAGLGCGGGAGFGFGAAPLSVDDERVILNAQREAIQRRLDALENRKEGE